MAFLNDRQRANFEAMISPEPNSGCWFWTGYTNSDGYGKFNISGRIDGAHRVAFREYKAEIPSGYLVLHGCDQPSCVNPGHLKIGTDVENAEDKARRRRTPTKISDEQVFLIRRARGRYKDIAAQFKISPSWVCLIKSGAARIHAKERS